MKTIAALTAAILVLGFAATATRAADQTLPPTYIVHKLTADGVALRSLEAEKGAYEARVEATDGTIVKVGVDPQTADLTDAYSHARARKAESPAPKVSAADAIQTAATSGYWDVREIELEDGVWEIEARNDQGRSRTVEVDAVTGALR